MKKKFLPIVIIILMGYSSVKAQFDTQLSNYWATIGYFNPAYAGQSGNLEATLMSRIQWLGVADAPRTTILTANMPRQLLGKIHGFGALIYNDRIGLFSATAYYGQYAWKKKLFKGDFSIGLQGGYITQSFDGTRVYIPENNDYHSAIDEAIPTSAVSGSGIDLSLGVFYQREKWFAGLSVNHLLAPRIKSDENYVFEIPRSFYFVGGYNIPLNNPLLELQSSLLLKTMQMSSYSLNSDSLTEKIKGNSLKAMLQNSQADISVRVIYDKKFWGGLSLRYGDAIVLMLGGKFKMIEAGYAYDFPISRIIKTSTGSHELFVRYSMDLNLKKKGKYKHKSIRIL
ncbi:MAG: type IX secretion system membrane protein PorP/SprF [Dysgonamonadaceae bacterium]|jgi:type IX secretion system PorP/SprF family membrane protein|nr:type IX secretion system membrane protein PorP/SprF [Dysgonamonadaceae bacterium]